MEIKKNIVPLGIFVFISLLLLFGLGDTKLTNWDEAWYAAISRKMLETGNLITPVWNTEHFFEKPPLYFWLTTAAFAIFGVSEFSVRLPSALAGIGTVLLVYYFAKDFFNTHTAFASAIILSSTPIFLYRSRTGNFDTLLAFFMFLTLVSFYRGYAGRSKWYLLFGSALALGFLAKGFIALYPLAIILVYLLVEGKITLVFKKRMLLGLLIAVVLIGTWFVVSFVINGNLFMKQFLQSNTEKFGFGLQSFRNFSPEYFFHLKSGLKLWFPFAFVSFFLGVFVLKNKKILLLYLYISIFIFAMSFSDIKSNWYILPVYPAIALLIGYAIYEMSQKLLPKRFIFMPVLFILIIACIQNIRYKDEYLVADIAGDEARVALAAKEATDVNDSIYMTNYYYPTVVYYSQRRVYAVYSEHEENASWWIKPKTAWTEILKQQNVAIVTTQEELRFLQDAFPDAAFITLFQSGSKLFVKKT